MDELKEYDLIEFPIDTEILGGIEFVKSEDTYITFIEDLNIRKKLIAKKIEKKTLLINLEDKPEILGISNNTYVFDTPIDFVFPVDQNVSSFYEKITKIIESGSTEELINLSNLLEKEVLPFYPLSILISNEQGDISLLKERNQLKSETKNLPQDNENDRMVGQFLKDIFQIHPILRIEYIKKEFIKKFGDKIPLNRVKVFLKSYYKFLNSGPFAKCWINEEVNEKENPFFYVYQVLGKKINHEAFYQLFEKPYLVEKVEKNKTLYFSGVYDEKLGYLTKLAMVDLENESEPEEEFEIYD